MSNIMTAITALKTLEAKAIKGDEYRQSMFTAEVKTLVDTIRPHEVVVEATGELKTNITIRAMLNGEKVRLTFWANANISVMPHRGELQTAVLVETGTYTPEDGGPSSRQFTVDTFGNGRHLATGYAQLMVLAKQTQRKAERTAWCVCRVQDEGFTRIKGERASIPVEVIESSKPGVPLGEAFVILDTDNDFYLNGRVDAFLYAVLNNAENQEVGQIRDEKGRVVFSCPNLYFRKGAYGAAPEEAITNYEVVRDEAKAEWAVKHSGKVPF